METTPHEKRCPLCGGANRCGAHGLGRCWCVDRVFPPELLAQIPAPQRLKACICPDCLDAYERIHPGSTTKAASGPARLMLQTPRLWLREFTDADAPFVRELVNEPSFLKHIGDRGVRTEADARIYLRDRYAASYARHGFGMWRVALRLDDTPVGLCGLAKRDYLDHPDVGFVFLERHAGRGYATESATEVVQHARTTLGLPRLLGMSSPGNAGLQRVLSKLGLQFERLIQAPGIDHDVMLFSSGA